MDLEKQQEVIYFEDQFLNSSKLKADGTDVLFYQPMDETVERFDVRMENPEKIIQDPLPTFDIHSLDIISYKNKQLEFYDLRLLDYKEGVLPFGIDRHPTLDDCDFEYVKVDS